MKKLLISLVTVFTLFVGVNGVKAEEYTLEDTNTLIVGERSYNLNEYNFTDADLTVATLEYQMLHPTATSVPVYYIGTSAEDSKELFVEEYDVSDLDSIVINEVKNADDVASVQKLINKETDVELENSPVFDLKLIVDSLLDEYLAEDITDLPIPAISKVSYDSEKKLFTITLSGNNGELVAVAAIDDTDADELEEVGDAIPVNNETMMMLMSLATTMVDIENITIDGKALTEIADAMEDITAGDVINRTFALKIPYRYIKDVRIFMEDLAAMNEAEEPEEDAILVGDPEDLVENFSMYNKYEKYLTSDNYETRYLEYSVKLEGKEAVVTNLEELNTALADETVLKITLGADIDARTTPVIVNRQVVIDGADYTLSFGELPEHTSGLIVLAPSVEVDNLTVTLTQKDGWQGNYAVQVYNTDFVVLKNVTMSNGDAGLLVNGANVTLKGTTKLTDNEFGGIEVSRGTDAEQDGYLTVDGNIVMNNESITTPVIWVEEDQGSVSFNDEDAFIEKYSSEKGQYFYYLDRFETEVTTYDELVAALDNEEVFTITLTDNIDAGTNSVIVNREVTINGNGRTLSFAELSKDPEAGKLYASGLVILADSVAVDNLTIVMTQQEGWQGNYVAQVYRADDVVLSNLELANGDAGLLVNGSNVTLRGVITLTGNAFGGIEVSSSDPENYYSELAVDEATITMENEAVDKPAIWIEGSEEPQGSISLEEGQLYSVDNTDSEQIYFYTSEEIAEAAEEALAAEPL